MAMQSSPRVKISAKAGLTIVVPPLAIRAVGEKSSFVWTLERGEVVECQLLKHGKKAGTIMLECPVGAGLVIQDRNALLGSAASGQAKETAPAYTPQQMAQALAMLKAAGIGGGKPAKKGKPEPVETDDDTKEEVA